MKQTELEILVVKKSSALPMGARPKLTVEQVKEIRAAGRRRLELQKELEELSNERLCEKYGVSKSSLWEVMSYSTYKYVRD